MTTPDACRWCIYPPDLGHASGCPRLGPPAYEAAYWLGHQVGRRPAASEGGTYEPITEEGTVWLLGWAVGAGL